MTSAPSNAFSNRIKALCFGIAFLCAVPLVAEEKSPRHLFILAGQSNMTGNLVKGFTAKVEAAYGKENIAIAVHCKPGRAIRYWCADWRDPDGQPLSDKVIAQNGSLYEPMLQAVKTAAGDKTFDSVTFIWMQGESDAMKGWSEIYAESFLKLLNRLKKDLNRESIRFVIGRLSDCDMENKKFPHWTKMREAQVKLAESQQEGAWINTDDLNDVAQAKPGADTLHYGPEESIQLGGRFADQAIAMIAKKSTP